MAITLRHMWLGIGGDPRGALRLPDVSLREVIIDSRQAKAGTCFVALPGEKRDGHEFVADALARGAVAALVTRVPDGVEATVVDVARYPREPVGLPVVFRVPDTLAALQRAAAYWRSLFSPRVVGITGSVGKTSTKEMTAAVLRQRFNVLWCWKWGPTFRGISRPYARSLIPTWALSPWWGSATWSGWARWSAFGRPSRNWCALCPRTAWPFLIGTMSR